MTWFNSREQRRCLGSIQLFNFAEIVKFSSCKTLALQLLVLAKDTDLTANCLCGVAIIPSNDDDPNACLLALSDGSGNLGARWVKHANKTKESEVLFQLGVLRGSFGVLQEWV